MTPRFPGCWFRRAVSTPVRFLVRVVNRVVCGLGVVLVSSQGWTDLARVRSNTCGSYVVWVGCSGLMLGMSRYGTVVGTVVAQGAKPVGIRVRGGGGRPRFAAAVALVSGSPGSPVIQPSQSFW